MESRVISRRALVIGLDMLLQLDPFQFKILPPYPTAKANPGKLVATPLRRKLSGCETAFHDEPFQLAWPTNVGAFYFLIDGK